MSKMTPFVKWAGGKKQILNIIIEKIIDFIKDNGHEFTFYEPFVGGGVVFLALEHKDVVINDLNAELINVYEIIRDDPHELIRLLEKMKNDYQGKPKYYYDLRAWDRDEKKYASKNNLEKAARTIFLNKTCYNGLYRVNLKGQFNTPMGRYKNPSIYDEKNILNISKYLNENNIKIMSCDYSKALEGVGAGDIIYLDPPYHYENENGFTSYQKEGFTFEDFEALKKKCDDCLAKEAYILMSNNETTRVRKLFESDPSYVVYDLKQLDTKRMINSKGSERNTGKELLIIGLPAQFPQANDISKIIKLIKSGDEIFQDSDLIREVIGKTDERTVQYYLSSLKYLKIINNEKKFSEFGLELYNEKCDDELKEKLAKEIVDKGIFKKVYDLEHDRHKLSNDEIVEEMIKDKLNKKYSNSTLKRRANTVSSWVKWCWNVLGSKNEDNN